MKITNNTGLPDPIANFADYSESRKYSAGAADFSVTTLIDSPRIHQLIKAHKHKLEKDVTESAMTMLGSAMHMIWEKGASFDHITEERLFLEVEGKTISGQIDLQEVMEDGRIRLIDFKVTSVWSKLFGEGLKKEWVEQQNLYATLVEENKGVDVESINICALFRDWKKAEAGRKAKYPAAPIELIKLPLWSKKKRMKFLKERVKRHKEAEEMLASDSTLPLCTDEERWMQPGKYALMREGRSRAIKLFDNEEELMGYALANGYARNIGGTTTLNNGMYSEGRKPTYKRCEEWCAVSEWCSQWRAEKVMEHIEETYDK